MQPRRDGPVIGSRIMKGLQFLLIAAVALFFVKAGLAADASADKRELERIKQEMREKQKEIRRADRKERSILSDLDGIDREIQAEKAELAEQQKQLRAAEAELREVEQSNIELHRRLEGLKRLYSRRIRALYKMSRDGYGAWGLTAVGEGGSLKRVRYLEAVAERDRTVIRDYADTLARLDAQQAEITEKRNGLLARHRAIEAEKADLQARKRKKAVLLASVRQEKSTYEQTLQELEEASTNLWAMIRKAEDERKAKSRFLSRTPAPRPSSGGTRLPWPVEGQVLTRFGRQRHPQFKTMVFRRGIEIEAREGEPVRAVSDGRVAYADWYKGYGKLLIIEHGPGFYTLYGNLSRLDLAAGEQVSQGQVIGLAGETGGSRDGLYFEMRRDGEAQDPLLWLSRR